MARLARVAMVGQAYHVTHRGNRRAPVFFGDDDRAEYLADLARCAADAGLEVWGYCLMSNHVHLLAVPRRPESLARGMGRAQQRHARRVNAAQGWMGHLWANRFFSTPLDEAHLWTAIKYIELNPVRAGLVREAAQWPWSSARAHAALRAPGMATPAAGAPAAHLASALLAAGRPFGGARPHPLTGKPIAWAEWLALGVADEDVARLREATSTGRPCGSRDFAAGLERALDRPLTPARRGPKPGPPPAGAAPGVSEIPGMFDP